uniref:Ig-like domain-containing protein n=1 Tax=Pelusios castaneus TaxID=367368 RepID=A0A8C8SDX3_9SAUR
PWFLPLLFCCLFCLSGCSSGLAAPALTGPQEVSGPLGRSVSVLCDYQKQYQYHEKYWCRGADWSSCKIVIQSTESDAERKRGRISLTDNRKLCSFTVTMENLTLADAGIYWCGISKVWRDYGVSVKVTVLQGVSASTCYVQDGCVLGRGGFSLPRSTQSLFSWLLSHSAILSALPSLPTHTRHSW